MSDLMREAFVQWLRTRPEVLNVGFDPVSGRFVLREDQERWEAWQASRECLVIELPDVSDMAERAENGNCYSAARLDQHSLVIKYIHAAGVKTK